jgi:two-component system, sensor histidine kinase
MASMTDKISPAGDTSTLAWLGLACGIMALYLLSQGGVLNLLMGLGLLLTGLAIVHSARVHSRLLAQASRIETERAALRTELSERQAMTVKETRLLAAVCHDLRQPIYSIALLTGAFQRIGAADGGLLEAARLNSSTPDKLGTASMKQLLTDIALQFSVQACSRGLTFQVKPSDIWAQTDEGQVRRILANLVSNAIRYTPQGGSIVVRCRLRGDRVWLQVWDTGVGIAKADRQRIFDEFVQVDGPVVTGRKGLGLGLSIAHQLAQRLGHPLVLRSRPGRGSLFAIGMRRAPGSMTLRGHEPKATSTQMRSASVSEVISC